MRFNTGNSRARIVAVSLALLFAAASGLRWLEERSIIVSAPQNVSTEQLTTLAGHGVLGLLGGMRSAVASACWLRANLAWERCDVAETTALIELTAATDERVLYFWLNGARMLANDLPEWRLAADAPAALRAVVNEEQAQAGLAFLQKGLRWRGPDAELYIEMANIHLRRRGDTESAARYYRLAAETPGAPHYAARIHGELLRALGRPAEALVWLKKILPTLKMEDGLARRDVVEGRISALEKELAQR